MFFVQTRQNGKTRRYGTFSTEYKAKIWAMSRERLFVEWHVYELESTKTDETVVPHDSVDDEILYFLG